MDDLTFGEKACDVSFNSSQHEKAEVIKRHFADIVDLLEDFRQESKKEHTEATEVRRMLSIAITEAQTAQMWAVKAVTWRH